MHPFLILVGKFFIGLIPGVDSEASWTITNLAYMVVSPFIVYQSMRRYGSVAAIIPHVPLGYGCSLPDRGACRCIRRLDPLGANRWCAKKWLLVTPIALSVGSFFMSCSFYLSFSSDFSSPLTTLITNLGRLPSVSPPLSSISSQNCLRYYQSERFIADLHLTSLII